MDQGKMGKFIAELRKEKNMTQDELANKLKVNSKSVSRWENGNQSPDVSLLKPLAELFGISVDELLSSERINKEDNNDIVNPLNREISKIGWIVGKVKNVVIEAEVIKFKVIEKNGGGMIIMEIKDETGNMSAILYGDNLEEFRKLANEMTIGKWYRIRGNVRIADENEDFKEAPSGKAIEIKAISPISK